MDAHLAFRFPGGHIHLGVCGSIAAYRAPDLLRQWQQAGFSVGVTLTPSARKFIAPLTFSSLGADPVYTVMFDDPAAPTPFPHLDPAHCAKALVIAPASAATLSRLACGQADELLACQALAFNGPVVLAPAMNPNMWAHPATVANVERLHQRGCRIVSPGCGGTACGDEGQGRFADIREVYLAGLRAVLEQDMAGRRVMVTLGPTREFWDGVRFWSNPSTGVMGAALAVAAWLRGAEVHAVCGPGCPWLPQSAGMFRHNAVTAKDMFEAASDIWDSMDTGIFTAAVADFAPAPFADAAANGERPKFKKSAAPDGFSVRFEPNPDILKQLSSVRRKDAPQKIMGFAAETTNLEQAVHDKLLSKRADMIVGNLACHGFGTTKDTVFVLDAQGRAEYVSDISKPELAWKLITWFLSL